MIRVVVEAVMVGVIASAASRGSTPARHGWLAFRHPDPAARAAAAAAKWILDEITRAVQHLLLKAVHRYFRQRRRWRNRAPRCGATVIRPVVSGRQVRVGG